MPVDGIWPTVAAFVAERTGDAAGTEERVQAGEVVFDDGTPVTLTTPYRPGERVHLHRDVPDETVVPGRMPVLYRDENIVVVDKPHFLATMPRGRHVRETVVLRLRAELDMPDLVPAHRLDRLTAGVLLLTTRPEVRAAYQELFAQRRVDKTYLAVAPLRTDLELPCEVRSRIVKARGSLQAFEVDGEVNAVTRIDDVRALPHEPTRGEYRLAPETGKTHQLRVHLNALGIPIENDPLYPQVRNVDPGDFSRPLRLIA